MKVILNTQLRKRYIFTRKPIIEDDDKRSEITIKRKKK